MQVRIVVADQSEADFYDVEQVEGALRAVGRLTDPQARLHDRDLKSDKPGRVFDHAPTQGTRRGATARHGTGGERRPRKHEAVVFAQQIARELARAREAGEYERLVVMAGPAFLGLLREAMPRAVRSTVVAEVPKDLIHQGPSAIQSHLSSDAFRPDVASG